MLIDHLPGESATIAAIAGGEPLPTRTEVLLAEIWQLLTRNRRPHPILRRLRRVARDVQDMTPQRRSAVEAARRRAAARRAKIETGEIT